MSFDAGDDEDVLMDAGPPKKPLAKRPMPKKAVVADDEEKLDGMAPPKRAPPARLAAKAGGAAASGPIKTIKASDIVEEDLGPGMSKESAIEKVTGFYDAAYVAAFEEAKWQDKQAGFVGFKE